MDREEKRKIMKNLILLKERLGRQANLDKIIDILIEKEIFQFSKKMQIFAPNLTDSQMMDMFLTYLTTSGPKAYEQFRDALLSFPDSRCEDVVSALDNTDLNTKRGNLNSVSL